MTTSSDLVTTDPATGLRRSPTTWMQTGEIPTPDGCRWCGCEQRSHVQRWKPSVGWHTWAPPTDAQRLARMKARRSRRLEPGRPAVAAAPDDASAARGTAVCPEDLAALADLARRFSEAARTGRLLKIEQQYGVRYSWANGTFDEISFPTRDEAQAEVDSDPQWRTLIYRTCTVPSEPPWGPWLTLSDRQGDHDA